jgi:sugar/nucleoside kinase (ribokinase family)
VIVVVGRPGLDAAGQLARTAARIALAAASDGGRVELVGSVGDDADGELVALQLGRNGIGHAALLRDPAVPTPHAPEPVEGDDAPGGEEAGPAAAPALPRLDAADLALGLSYLAECQVLVVAEPLASDALAAAFEAARYHGAGLVVLTPSGAAPENVPANATVLELPEIAIEPFNRLIGLYAAHLDAGRAAADAWQDALASSGWEAAAQ